VRIVDGEEIVDEIDDFVEGRYISPVDACWRIFGFDLHGQSHTVVRLPVHLEDAQTIYFNEGDDLSQRDAPATRLTAYFKVCASDEEARDLTYVELPLHYCWQPSTRSWKRRVLARPNTLARMHSVSVREGERFFLRLLLSHVAGPTSFQDLRTFDGVVYSTFKEACVARGMLEDDSMWVSTIEEVATHASPVQLRQLFVSVLTLAHPANPAALWEQFRPFLSGDFTHVMLIAFLRTQCTKSTACCVS
jgi:ATP-dependent DNA helicase PIF1